MTDGKITVVVVDDNLAAIELLVSTLERKYHASIKVVATATNSRDAESLIALHRPDLLFLDVELPDKSGLEYASELRKRFGSGMRIVLYTSYEKYLIGALRVSAFDFLLKPLVESELDTVISRYVGARAADTPGVPADVQAVPGRSKPLLITTVTNEKLVLRPDDIGYFCYLSDRKRWEVVLAGGKRHMLFGQTTADDILAYGPEFVRIHKAYIININYLASVQESSCVMLPPFDSADELKVSKNYRKDLVDRFYSL